MGVRLRVATHLYRAVREPRRRAFLLPLLPARRQVLIMLLSPREHGKQPPSRPVPYAPHALGLHRGPELAHGRHGAAHGRGRSLGRMPPECRAVREVSVRIRSRLVELMVLAGEVGEVGGGWRGFASVLGVRRGAARAR